MNTVITPAYFDAAASTWDEDPVKQARAQAAAAAIRRRVALHPAMSGFEFGCGTGLLSFALRHDLARLTLADSSVGMLTVLQGKIDAAGLDSMRALPFDFEHDALPEERFDLVYSLMAFHHVQDTDRLLRSLRALLKSPGYLCVFDLDSEDGSFHGAERVFHPGFDRDDLARRALQAGFCQPDFETVFVMHKTVDGQEKSFPVFLMVARAD